MNTRRIGKITSVDSFRILVELDDNLKSLFKSGFNDIYEIARINSYIIVPVGSDRIVAIVTRVKVQDETEIERNHGAITLPKSKRYLVATMIGTIQGNNTYLQGVYNYPILDNPVWYVVKDDLDKIFDTKEDSDTIDFEKDYFLPIGTSPAFSDYKIKINPDRFFGKHAAILGNTGSGKSCTVSSIIQTLFRFSFPVQEKDENGENELRTKNLENAHFIIFDTNGEYKKAFGFDENNPYAEKSIVNSFYIDKDGMKIPYWFMNFDDFDYLFEPSSGTQVPLLKSALGLAKERTEESIMQGIDSYIEKGIMSLLDASPDDIKKKKLKYVLTSFIFLKLTIYLTSFFLYYPIILFMLLFIFLNYSFAFKLKNILIILLAKPLSCFFSSLQICTSFNCVLKFVSCSKACSNSFSISS